MPGKLKSSIRNRLRIAEVPVSEPQLRCLLCDLLLAEEGRTETPTETCRQCGRKVVAGQSGSDVELQPLNPPPKAKPVALDLELLPEAAVVSPPTPPPLPPPTADDIPSVPVLTKAKRVEPDVPTVQPRGKITSDPTSVPYAAKRVADAPTRPGPNFPSSPPPPAPPANRPSGKAMPQFPPRKVSIPDPARVSSATPKPKVIQAFAILGCMTFLAVVAIIIIISCIVIGLMKAAKLV